jgi:hypothetical protein
MYDCQNPACDAGEGRLIRPWLAMGGIATATIGTLELIGGLAAVSVMLGSYLVLVWMTPLIYGEVSD